MSHSKKIQAVGDSPLLLRKQRLATIDFELQNSTKFRQLRGIGHKYPGASKEHQELTIPIIASLCSDSARIPFMEALDAAARKQSNEIKKRARQAGPLYFQVLTIGSGPSGVVVNSRLFNDSPGTSMLTIDEGECLGGQFRAFGDRPIFNLNSHGQRPGDTGDAYESASLNYLGPCVPLQVADFAGTRHPTNADLGTALAVNQYLSTSTVLRCRVDTILAGSNGAGQRSYNVYATDLESQQKLCFSCNYVVVGTGSGIHTTSVPVLDERSNLRVDVRSHEGPTSVLGLPDFLSRFGDAKNTFPMAPFVGKKVAVVGGGDSALVVAELLSFNGPGPAYGLSTEEMGRPKNISIYGLPYSDEKSFRENVFPRYLNLAPLMPTAGSDRKPFILPRATVAISVISGSKHAYVLLSEDEVKSEHNKFDYVIVATGLKNELGQLLGGFKDNRQELELSEVQVDLGEHKNVPIAKRITGENVYIVGPAADIPMQPHEVSRLKHPTARLDNKRITVWRNLPLIERFAAALAQQIRQGSS